jgi:hypothetical protein
MIGSPRRTDRNSKRAPAAKSKRTSRLKRPIQRMPAFVRKALTARRLTSAFRSRPAYQRNDYLGWITAAQREPTQHKRLQQMLAELANGRVYMNMKWNPARR